VATDEELVSMLDRVWGSLSELGRGLDEAQWKTATDVPGWTVQDNLVHITGLESSLLGRPAPEHAVPDDLPHVKNDIGRGNEVFVDSRRSWSGEQALAEFRDVTAERLAELRRLGPDGFGAESWTPMGPGAVRDLLPFRIFDSWVHEQDMRGGLEVPGHLDGPVAQEALGRVVGAMPFVVGKKAAAPDGATVVFELSAPLAATISIGVDGRAKLLDAPPRDPTAVIATDGATFTRLATGRADPAAALAAGSVRLVGDEALGRRVVESLNFLF
jgi:uncharacterized protein (TIGR03083 family)